MVELTKLHKVHVTWIDSSGGDTGWEPVENLDDVHCNIIICESLGWVLKETDDALTIAHNVSDGHSGAEAQFTMGMTIPKVAIIKRKNI